MSKTAKTAEPSLLARLRTHFAADPSTLPVVEQTFDDYHRPNLHLSVEELLGGRSPALVGIVLGDDYHGVSLSRLSRMPSAEGYQEGPVEYVDVELADGARLACVKRGLYLFRDAERPLALLISPNPHSWVGGVEVSVMAADREAAEAFSRRLTRGVRHGAAYRGKVLSLEVDCHRRTQVKFHKLPPVTRESVILPEALLARIERHAIGFTRHADKLRAAGRHLKRGILLHGLPGTGKTLSAMYLASQMPGRTVLILTGATIGAIETACAMARLLEPSTVILEDVDLIGTQREHQTVSANAVLFELLNQMDGLGEDADILFVLTTNRPDELEPALAARPGRVDLAIEVPLPDADCRRRLIDLYARGLNVQSSRMDKWVKRTEGVSGAFIREMLRKATLLAADEADSIEVVVRDAHLEEAIAELLVAGGPLTQTLLGATRAAKATNGKPAGRRAAAARNGRGRK